MNLWIAQQLCPQRHCVVALAYDADELTQIAVETVLREQLDALHVNPWCGLCGSRELRVEHARLRAQDWPSATRELRAAEAAQAQARAWLKGQSN